ncbi:Plectin [Bagarius yarrelli]|uniref:Plectin n=1 Tax=Bagarius yarrelli TaxID=175774 RepID=A0A556TPT1_BAGYA|nr:Plectin [Bagarius yarrelli]
MESVRRYLQGTDCIAGVFVQSTKQTMSISEAKLKGLLTPGTSLVLLEAQAATGFMIDPLNNKKLSVEEAVAQGALKKDLIVKDHGIRLLEAQIATGGIIDPVYSHRVPVEVAYQRGYFDEEMNQILSDSGDDTKGFFDPNTQENLTYLQLLDRCIKDQNTGLRLLVVVKKGGEFYFYVDEHTKTILQSTTTNKAGGKFLGKEVSLWDLIHSEYIDEEKKRDLVQRFKSGTITIDCYWIYDRSIEQQKALSGGGAVAQGGRGELNGKAKLLSAERAVTGYTDPHTGNTISLFQALKKDLIVKDHGIRLLEAQIATGGIIDPVYSHRVPVEVAYQRGYFDEEMNQILSDSGDDTKGFFDPNTQENLTYLQLLGQGIKDPRTLVLDASCL